MARLRNSEWAMMIIQRTLEIEPGKRKLFLSTLEKLQLLDNPTDIGWTKRIVDNRKGFVETHNQILQTKD